MKYFRLNITHSIFFILAFASFIVLGYRNLFWHIPLGEHFIWLARAFNHGSLSFLFNTPPSNFFNDFIILGDKFYWALGPLPAVFFIPFVALFDFFYAPFFTGYIQFFLIIATWFQIYRMARKISYCKIDSIYLSSAFCFGSVYLLTAIFPRSYEFSHVLCVFLMFSLFLEYFSKRRWYFIGTIIGLLMLTRLTTSLVLIFFVIEIFRKYWKSREELVVILTRILIPILILLTLLAFYNLERFGSSFEQGYALQRLVYAPLIEARSYGVLSPIHLAGNLYYAFLSMPIPVFKDGVSHVLAPPYIRPDGWGLSIFFTSPFMLSFFFLQYKKKIYSLWVAASLVALPIFFYYGIGNYQIGYRYSLDFLPILFIIFLLAYKDTRGDLTNRMKVAIIFSLALDLYLLYSIGLIGFII